MSKTFDEITQPDGSILLVVDGINLAFRWKHSKARYFVDDYINTVKSLGKSYKATKIVILSDKGGSSYRKALYPEYKQNRKDKIAEQTAEDALAFEEFIEEYNQTLIEAEKQGITVIMFDGVEADDIAAVLATNIDNAPYDEIWLISSDRDWDLLLSEKVSRFSYVTRKEYTIDNWNTHYDCEPEEYISIKCLMGDPGDNVPGVPSIGPKRAVSLVKEYGSALDIVDALPIQSKYKYISALNEFGARGILLNYQLMDLVSFCREAIGAENLVTLNKIIEELYNDKSIDEMF